ncbi:MAG: DUF2232 domain-containing protein [Bacteroidetes bacterium]|nr:DUF2232 domain-containing protein [Bacteroidota bacterium]
MKTFGILFPHNPFLRILLIISFFVAAATFVPIFDITFLLLLPMILFFYSVTTSRIKSAGAFLISFSLLFFFSHFFQFASPYPAILTMGIAGLIISTLILKNESIEKTVIYTSLIIIASICAYFLYSGYNQNINPWHLVQKFVAETVEENIKMYSKLPFDKEDINFIKDNKQSIIDFFTGIFPSLVIVASAFIVWINILMGRNFFRKQGILLSQLEGLSRWKAPEFTIWIFIASCTLLFVPFEQIIIFSRNILIMTCFVYLLQGFAIISFVFQNKNVPIFFRYLLYFLIAVQQIFMIPIMVAGLFDIWIDFRRFFQRDRTTT